jgi:subtilisin family serine protease
VLRTSGRAANAALIKKGFTVYSDGRVGAMVELVDPPAVEVYLRSPGVSAMAVGTKASSLVAAQAAAAARAHIAHLDQVQKDMVDVLTGPGIAADLIYRVQRVYNGIAVQVDGAALNQIRALPGVKAVHPLVPKHLDNFTSVPFIGAPQVWGGVGGGATGAGVKVGVIDTGIDYIHFDFGGSGTYRSGGKYVSASWPKTAKVVGGYDFAGDNYDATAASGSTTPSPDPDPMDCNGHGSHVAGTLAGYGENADGSTFKGPWNASTPISTFMIGPGVAPGAELYALKIFGCSGQTNLVTQAIDWAIDPNGDGNFADHLDIISMSLGSEYGVPDDPDAQASDRAAQLGVIVVTAAGNSGDAYFVINTPGDAGRAIAVAATGDPGVFYATLRVNTPAAIAGDYPGQPGLFGPDLPTTPITGNLVLATPNDGCSSLSNQSAVSGNIALMFRNYGTSNACNFTVKVKNAQNAGAVAAIVADNLAESFLVTMAGSDPTITIPSFFISLADGLMLQGQLPSPGINATLIRVDMTDTMAYFSARGPRSGDAVLKPDIAAPGLEIFSVATGTVSGGVSLEGTSMATPHVSGVMALLRQLHPAWTVEELKALVMNTAVHDVTVNANAVPPYVGTGRSGAGRVDAAAAATTQAVAFDADDAGLVSVSFGAVEVSGTTNVTKNITVANKSGVAQTYTLGFTPVATVPGVSFSFPNGTSLTVPPNGALTFPVQLNANGAALRHTMDPSISTTSETYPRFWLSEEDGYVTLTPPSGSPLQVPIYAAVRPTSAMAALQSTVGLSGSSGLATVDLAGQGISTGTAYPTDILSLVSAFELLEDNPDRATSDARYLGAASDYQFQVQNGKALADSTIYFGIAFHQGWSSPVPVVADIYIDVNGDGKPDFDLFVTDYSYFSGNPVYDDVYIASLCKTATSVCSLKPLNGITPNVLDTVPMGTNVIVLPVAASDLGLADGKSRFSFYFGRTTGTQVVHSFDPAHPGLFFGGPFAVAGSGQPIFPDLTSQFIQVGYSQSDYTTDNAEGILLLHHHNGAGSHAESIAAAFGSCSVSATATAPVAAAPGEPISFEASASATSCTGDASYLWDFGDGSADSSLQNPSHVYTKAGTYAWRLVVAYGSFSVTKTGSITVARPASVPRRHLSRAT